MCVHLAKNAFSDQPSQQSLIAAMMEPTFYPKLPAEVAHKETHISHLFFAGDLVYKVKKAVRYSFVDYSTLARRRHYLQEELRLNRRLAPSVYLGVLPIVFDESEWRLGGWAEPVEYTLVMRRLPDKRMLPFLLETEQATPDMMHDLGEHLARFHAAAERAHAVDPTAYFSIVEHRWNENLTDVGSFTENITDREALKAIKLFGAEFMQAYRQLFLRRASQGWIRDVHGDLHAEHICFAPEGIQIFDCIEFSAELRRCDLASEIAFLLMDMEVRGGESLTKPLLMRYLQRTDDAELPVLLPFFKCYRALVRAKVHALRARKWHAEAARYLRFASRLTWEPFKPFLVLVGGLSGSGKSTLARELGERLGLTVIKSDSVRKRVAGSATRQYAALNEGIYSPALTEKTYVKMIRLAEKQIIGGEGAILDATFARRAHREKAIRLADQRKIPMFVIRCVASDDSTRERLDRRVAEGKDISDGRWEIYLEQKGAFEPIDELPLDSVLELNTEAPPGRLVDRCERFLRSRLGGNQKRSNPFGHEQNDQPEV